MAGPKSASPSSASRPSRTAATPATAPAPQGVQWRNLAIGGGILAILWITAFASNSKVFIVVMGVLTVAIAGMLLWILRWARKQRAMMELLQTASLSPQARRDALQKLEASGADGDALNAVARARLQAEEDPELALTTLEGIDPRKVPMTMADEVRAMRAQMYLLLGRAKEARPQVDEIKLSNAGSTEARGALAATVAEAWARTGKHVEALDLLGTISPDDKDFASVRSALLFARVYASFAAGNRDAVRRDMQSLVRQDPNLLGRFVMPKAKTHPELQKIARDLLQRDPGVRKMMQKQQRPVRRR